MNTSIKSYEKKAFIFWFLNQYDIKLREANWILTFIANNKHTLENVHFVRDADRTERSIIIATKCSDKPAFQFHKGELMTTDAEKAFHDIRLNPFEPLYIELHFHQSNQSPQYAFVLEENPFLPDKFYITSEDKKQTKSIINYSLQLHKREALLKKIDQALDSKDKEQFLTLTNELNDIEMTLLNQPTH
ncbi:ReoY family proteolytic degradation factor [Oceanobacillus sp. CAU 1775]